MKFSKFKHNKVLCVLEGHWRFRFVCFKNRCFANSEQTDSLEILASRMNKKKKNPQSDKGSEDLQFGDFSKLFFVLW